MQRKKHWLWLFALTLATVFLLACSGFGTPNDTPDGSADTTSHDAVPTATDDDPSLEHDTQRDTSTPEQGSDDSDTGSDDSASELGTESGSDSTSETDSFGVCDAKVAVVTDVDETLTTSDNEWLLQIAIPGYDPKMRSDADALMRGYADLGYRVFYVTARGELLRLLSGDSSRDATKSWLLAHNFPFEDGALYLAPGLAALNASAQTYKTQTLKKLVADGWQIAYAYGNADTDIKAYQAAGVPNDRIFLVGDLAGQLGAQPISNADAYTQHLESFLPTVPQSDCTPP